MTMFVLFLIIVASFLVCAIYYLFSFNEEQPANTPLEKLEDYSGLPYRFDPKERYFVTSQDKE